MNLHGPGVGRRQDMFIFGDSDLYDDLSTVMKIIGKQYVVFDDSVYFERRYMVCSFSVSNLTSPMNVFNKGMERRRFIIE